ncbi:9374_t:CDS:1, partial [Racocetra persica]
IREHENHKQSNEIFKDEEIDDEIILKYEPGKWDVWEINSTSHFSLVPVLYETKNHELFFRGYKDYLDCLDKL